MITWCLCNTAAATASWTSVDLDEFLELTASGDWFRRAGRRAGGKRQPAWCSRKTQDKFTIAFVAKKLLHRCIGAHARVHMHFLRRMSIHSQVLLSTMHVQVCTLDRCCEHQRTHLLHARYRMWICAHVCAPLLVYGSHSRLPGRRIHLWQNSIFAILFADFIKKLKNSL